MFSEQSDGLSVCCTLCLRCLTQVTKQLHAQCCEDKEQQHEEKTQIPHLKAEEEDEEKERDAEGNQKLYQITLEDGQ